MKKIILFLTLSLLVLPFLQAGTYGAGTYSTGVYTIGEVPVTPVSPGGGGGSSGTSCVYDWQCTNWFPLECPELEIQERICANKGTCTGILGMPEQTRTCVYEGPTEPMFDIFLTIPQQYTKICAGRKIQANINLENYGKVELLDAFMTYWIINKNNTLIAELKDTRAIKDKINFNTEIKIPELTPQGTYRLYAQITYSENKTAVAGESFEIIEGPMCKIYYDIPKYVLIILIASVFIIIIILIIKQTKKNIQEKKKNAPKKKKRKLFFKKKKEKGEIISSNTMKKTFPKIKKSSSKAKKSPKNQEKFKKQMFTKLVEDTVKLKKQAKKKK